RKSTLATRAGRQTVCGLVVNDGPNVSREEYDTLKAILKNAARHGGESQNRDRVPVFRAHLHGRIAWVQSTNSTCGAKLRERTRRSSGTDTASPQRAFAALTEAAGRY
ncbi:MAG TPA: hypothetical protein VKS25_08470, partial [Solirubrobacteraceae bacterium]|nr:hypothetical protein [Solirubrobacteraceae bacterium]